MNMPTANAVADALEGGYTITHEELLDADIAEKVAADALKDAGVPPPWRPWPVQQRAAADALKEAGITEIDGVQYMTDAKVRLVPVETVKDADKLEDQTVRKIIGFAEPLAAQVARFRQHSFDDVDALIALLDEQYGVKKGGQKGNITLTSFDGLMKVSVQIGENISFGPQLQAAKSLVDECLKEWTQGSNANLRAIVDRAFQVDKEGKINRGELLGLRRLNITDPRWISAMDAINDSIRVIGTKRYVRTYVRPNAMAPWSPIVIDVAAS